ncbi:AfsR/SARP family transcriptional regulator [Nocardia rhizosphaerae]|uniref:BTAD domain-containing putative transcriptional regulator n=1 Tax=Nocardia rhizosphaerae TaxID=1691571 RepID=A0ABV8LAM7_9NOCA
MPISAPHTTPSTGHWCLAADAPYRVEFFGPFQVTRSDQAIGYPRWPRASARKLLQWFLLNPLTPRSGAALAEILWPDQPHARRSSTLRVTVHCLRQLLEPSANPRQSTFVLVDEHGRYLFDPAGHWWTDLLEVEHLLRHADAARAAGNDAVAIGSYQRALRYHERGFLPEGVYEDAIAGHRDAAERQHRTILTHLLELSQAIGLDFEVGQLAAKLLDRDPYSEAAVLALAGASVRQGDTVRAVAVLDRFIHTVRSELATSPSEQVLALRQRAHGAG